MERIVLCTTNPGKVTEIRALLPLGIGLVSLSDLGLHGDLPETGETLQDNAIQKASYVHARCGLPCLADDTGLEVKALGGAPGVYSARYAGPACDPQANMAKLLRELEGASDRSACFRTVIALVGEGPPRCFEGTVQGSITKEPKGTNGFGYDPIFLPEGGLLTFAEMSREEKNKVSHRARALARLMDHFASGAASSS